MTSRSDARLLTLLALLGCGDAPESTAPPPDTTDTEPRDTGPCDMFGVACDASMDWHYLCNPCTDGTWACYESTHDHYTWSRGAYPCNCIGPDGLPLYIPRCEDVTTSSGGTVVPP